MKKSLVGVALTLCLGLSAALSAPAQAFTPGGTFTLTGTANVIKPPLSMACTVTLNVSAPVAPGGDITSAVFSGGPLGACSTITPVGLPWRIQYVSPTSVQITGVALNVLSPPTCGPATLVGAWSNTAPGQLALTSAPLGACTLSWNLSASPPQTLP